MQQTVRIELDPGVYRVTWRAKWDDGRTFSETIVTPVLRDIPTAIKELRDDAEKHRAAQPILV